MKNISVEVDGKLLTITVDLSQSLGPSKSGKTILIASTEGNPEIAEGISMGLNVYKKKS